MRTPRSRLALVSSLTLLLAGCVVAVDAGCGSSFARETVRGSGVEKTETRTVGDFERVEIRCSADLTVRSGAPTSLTVSGDDNLLSFLTTEVRDKTLVVEMERGSYSSKKGMRLAATVPALRAVSVQGSSDVDVSDLSGESFAVEIAGSGDVSATGKVEDLEAEIQGSGDVNCADLEARRARIGIAGSGDVEVWAVENLSVSVAGSGDVRYKGEPKVVKSIAGSGSVSRR